MRTSNPAFRNNIFDNTITIDEHETMTVQGTVNKIAILTLLFLLSAGYSWFSLLSRGFEGFQFGFLIGMFAGFATIFKPSWSPISAPIYALAQGLAVGGISAILELSYPGIVIQAVCLTVGTLCSLLFLYKSEMIVLSDQFKTGILAATGGVALVYMMSMIMGFFGMPLSIIQGNGLFSILFSLFVVAVASFNLILDFDFICQGERVRAPKYMEWYGAFGIMVTLIWLYIEILRLLQKLRSRD